MYLILYINPTLHPFSSLPKRFGILVFLRALVVDKLVEKPFRFAQSINKIRVMANSKKQISTLPTGKKCSECRRKLNEEERITFDDRLWCEDCLSEKTAVCADCDERVYLEGVTYVGDDPICEGCYEHSYFQCERCDRHYHQEDYGGDGYCRYCLEEDTNPAVYPDNRRYRSKSRRDLPVGVEIEAEGGDYHRVYNDLAHKGFGVQDDGSLDSSGIEIQVPASNGRATLKLVQQACRSLEENGFDISRRCGLHVHIEYPSRMKTIKHLLLMIYACEPVFYAVNPPSRRVNNFCQPLNGSFSAHEIMRTKAKNMDKLFYSKKHRHLTRSQVKDFKKTKWNDCRYFGFNLHSLFYQRTVEFRYHAGTMAPDKIIPWIRLLKAILLYVRFSYNQEEVLRLIEQPTILSKVKYLKRILRLDEPLTTYLINRYIKFRKQYVRDHLR